MKKLLLLIGIVLLSGIVLAQDKINDLKAPGSPASVALGLQPTEILAPKSYNALETELYSNFVDGGNFIIPKDFGLEFTPYWTKDRGMSLKEYLFPNFGNQLIRNLSFSLASSQNFLLGDSTKTSGLGFGARTTIYVSNPKDKDTVNMYKNQLNQLQVVRLSIFNEASELIYIQTITDSIVFLNKIVPIIESKLVEYGFDLKDPNIIQSQEQLNVELRQNLSQIKGKEDTFLDDFSDLLDKHLKIDESDIFQITEKFQSYINDRCGFSLDLAYAGLINFPTNNLEFSYIPHQYVWITPTYRFKNKWKFLKVLGVIRYEWYNLNYYKNFFPTSTIYEKNWDFGIAASAQFDKFSFQFEYIGRKSSSYIPTGFDQNGNETFTREKDSDIQYTGTFSYNLTSQMTVSYTIGNKFNPILNPGNTLVSTLMLNLGFGAPKAESISTL
ncbi:MAG: hypothetical protein ACJA1C_002170 [Crocinitomicaceae bacterium]|jgi:hypothetical protein